MSAPKGKSKRSREDSEAKDKLGPAPSDYSKRARGAHPDGSYIQQSRDHKQTPSGRPVEVDHMTPDVLHQPVGQRRSGGDGASLSKNLPASAMNKTQHRRKLTTGSGHEPEHHRSYLLHVHHGLAPMALRMKNTQDHYAAAVEVELRSSSTPATLFGATTVHDTRTFSKPSHVGDVSMADAQWGLARQADMLSHIGSTGHIAPEHVTHLSEVITERRNALPAMYAAFKKK
jgi:hypothetical protein